MGTIETGKLANFVILDRNPFETDPAQLKDINIIQTVFKGKNYYTN